ncbi:MAG: glycosyltransferase family 4 protein [Salibacteraceae bacterium]|nr:glycosyltransferase family 4 protein [Salibacteraceae bacterium]MDP4763634.1 glycosyltransferase family 4 protein [Salibacteraceae bacterium]MDP4843200.1 glycosyltransferase family 4 protein [Salibacteraceae bacterium]MDP4965069.1 glycosyltransferase family 4 protein [Salibacteraceae bacterium]
MEKSAIINSKFKKQRTTGVQRYALGVSAFIDDAIFFEPKSKNSLLQVLWEQISLPLKAKREGLLLINFCNTAPFWYKKQMVTIHDMAVFENPVWFRPAFAKYYQWLFKKLAKNAKHFVTVSEFSKQEIHRHLGIPLTKISIIHSAVSDDFIEVNSHKPASAPIGNFILMVGSHDPRKNFDFVIGATQQWCTQNQYQLVIAGNPGKAFADKALAPETEAIWLQGLNDAELKWLYENAKLVIHPSIYEGFSLVPIEAHLIGAKCLISDIPVHREIVGKAAHYFELANAEHLILQIDHALNSPFEPIPLPYSFEKSGKDWMELISEMDA